MESAAMEFRHSCHLMIKAALRLDITIRGRTYLQRRIKTIKYIGD